VQPDIFASLLNGRFNSWDRNQLHMIFAYMDDSSDGYRAEYFVSGGAIAGEERWIKSRPTDQRSFYIDWSVTCKDLKNPFHSAECSSQHGDFKGWTKPACAAFMDRLVNIIVSHGISGFASIVPIRLYKQVFPEAKLYDPYYLTVRHTLLALAGMGQLEKDRFGFGGLKCWFELDRKTKPTIERIYDALKKLKTWEPASSLEETPNFDTKKLVPLQAADMIAREAFRRYMYPGQSSKETDQMKGQLNFACWNLPTLEYLRDHGGPSDMGALARWHTNPDPPPPFDVFSPPSVDINLGVESML